MSITATLLTVSGLTLSSLMTYVIFFIFLFFLYFCMDVQTCGNILSESRWVAEWNWNQPYSFSVCRQPDCRNQRSVATETRYQQLSQVLAFRNQSSEKPVFKKAQPTRQGRSQEFAKGTKEAVQGQSSGGGLGRSPRSWRHMLNIRLNKAIDRHKSRAVQSAIILWKNFQLRWGWGHAPMSPPLGYATATGSFGLYWVFGLFVWTSKEACWLI